jgi:MFS family permease
MAELVDRDEEHLRLLKLCYYVLASMTAVYSFFSMIFLVFGSVILSTIIPKEQAGSQMDPRAFGLLFLGIAIAAVAAGFGSAIAAFLTAHNLRDHRRRTFCIVIAACTCIYIPWGTIIGICTIMVLNRPAVRTLFDETRPPENTLSAP